MNRNEEYWALVAELGETPPALDGTVERARVRARKARAGRWLGIPAASLAGAASAFILLVNCSMPFAMACRRVPFVRALAEAVAVAPSLKAAFENDYIQPVGQTRTADGVTLSVEYLIVDERQLNVFYTLGWDGENALEAQPALLAQDGEHLEGYAATWGSPGEELQEKDYRVATFYFAEGSLPDRLTLRFDVRDAGYAKAGQGAAESRAAPADGPWPEETPQDRPAAMVSFDFPLTIDTGLIGPGRTVRAEQWIELDGQRLRVDGLSIDPTQMVLTLSDDPNNTAWLTGLDCYVADEKGNRYEKGGVSFGSAEGEHFWPNYTLESPYFTGGEAFTLVITGCSWLDKDRTQVTLDLETGEADWLPEGLFVESIERRGEDVYLSLRNDGQGTSFQWYYYDPEGGEHEWGGYSMSAVDRDEDGWCEENTEYRVLRDYGWDSVKLALSTNRRIELETPLEVPLF